MTYIKIAWNDKSAKCSCVSDYFYFVWWSRLVGSSARTYEKWSVFSIFSSLGPFPQVFGKVKEWLVRTAQNNKIVTCSYVPSCFYFVLWAKLSGRSVQSCEKWLFFSVFSQLGPLSQDFGQRWFMLKLHKTK